MNCLASTGPAALVPLVIGAVLAIAIGVVLVRAARSRTAVRITVLTLALAAAVTVPLIGGGSSRASAATAASGCTSASGEISPLTASSTERPPGTRPSGSSNPGETDPGGSGTGDGDGDVQYIAADIAPGSLSISTPYTAVNPLHLSDLVLNPGATQLTSSARFGDGTLAGSIRIVDTRSGTADWTASASASALTSADASIADENLGLTDLSVISVPGDALTSDNVEVTDVPAPSTALPSDDSGDQGLGGGAHPFARSTAGGNGVVGITGTLTIIAPTATPAGTYQGTITFTVV